MILTHAALRAVQLALIGSFCFFAPLAAGATEHIHGNTAVLPASQTLDDDLMIAGSSVSVLGTVTGDVMAAGASVDLAGIAKKDVLAAGATVTVSGRVEDDVRAAGGTVTLNGPVKHNVTLFGGTILVRKAAAIGCDANISGGNVQIEAPVARNLDLSAGEVRLASEVGGKLTMHGDKLILLPGSVVRGNLSYYGPQAPEIQPGAKVFGAVDFHKTESSPQSSPARNWPGDWLYRFLAFTIVGLVVAGTAPNWLSRVGETAARRTGLSVLAGIVWLIVAPVLFVVLCITVIGIPLALALGVAYLGVTLLSGVLVAYPLGAWLLDLFHRPAASAYARVTVGVLVLALFVTMPAVGWIFQCLAIALGSGALLMERFTARPGGSPTPVPISTPPMAAPGTV